MSNGYRVAGAELSKLAIEQLFSELGLEPNITAFEDFSRYSAKNIDIFVGDIFGMVPEVVGTVDAIYDRAALVALPESIREKYPSHLIKLTRGAPQLLITYVYEQHLLDGPPFSVPGEKVREYYKKSYAVKLIASTPIEGGLKGRCAAEQDVWVLQPLHAQHR